MREEPKESETRSDGRRKETDKSASGTCVSLSCCDWLSVPERLALQGNRQRDAPRNPVERKRKNEDESERDREKERVARKSVVSERQDVS